MRHEKEEKFWGIMRNRDALFPLLFCLLVTFLIVSSANAQLVPPVIQEIRLNEQTGVTPAVSGVIQAPVIENVRGSVSHPLLSTSPGVENLNPGENGREAIGSFLLTWGGYGTANKKFDYPSAVAVTRDGKRVYVVDAGNNRIQVFSPNGAFITKWGGPGTANGKFDSPQGIAVSPDGKRVYVADSGNNRIQVFSPNGAFIKKWGGQGTANGKFMYPPAVAVSPDGKRVYVIDMFNGRVQVFTPNGAFIKKWGKPGTANGEFIHPWGLAVAPNGRVYVTDFLNARVQVFSPNGAFIKKWGKPGTANGEFVNPRGIAVSSDGKRVYTTEADGITYDRVQVFTPYGAFIKKWGGHGTARGLFSYPFGVATGPGRVYVADSENDRIQVFSG